MKRFIALLIALVVVFSVTGCATNGGTQTQNSDNGSSVQSESSEQSKEKIEKNGKTYWRVHDDVVCHIDKVFIDTDNSYLFDDDYEAYVFYSMSSEKSNFYPLSDVRFLVNGVNVYNDSADLNTNWINQDILDGTKYSGALSYKVYSPDKTYFGMALFYISKFDKEHLESIKMKDNYSYDGYDIPIESIQYVSGMNSSYLK